MFIEQGISKDNPFWKYIVGSLIIILAAFIGQLPLLFVVLAEAINGGGMPTTNEEMLQYLEPNLSLFLIMISFVFTIGGVYLAVKYLHKQTFLSVTTARPKVDWNRILFSFSIWALFTVITTFAYVYYEPESFVWNFKPMQFAILCVIAVVLIPFQTSTEEYIFRGYLMQGFGNLAKNKWFPLVMTSVIFGVMHIMNPEVTKLGYIVMVFYIGTGFLLGIMTLMDEGMELALGFHAANNLVGALLVTSDWTAFQTHSLLKDISEPDAGLDIILPVVLIYPIVLFILAKKYQWTNWKEKLTGTLSESDSKVN